MERESHREREPDVFSVLDGIDFEALAEMQKIPGFTQLADDLVRDALESDLAKELRAEIELAEEQSYPRTFDDMLDPTIGKAWQRIAKWYMRVGDAKSSIQSLELIGVDKMPGLAKRLLDRENVEHRKRKIAAKHTDNFFLRDPEFKTLLDFATNQTGKNEAIHLTGVLLMTLILGGVAAAPTVLNKELEGHPQAMIVIAGFILYELYLVLGQRYTRARVSRIIDRMLKSKAAKAGFDLEGYENRLGLTLPKEKSE